jgi:hypothetical protein
MARSLTDKATRDEMVVMLEGMPSEDIDATLTETASDSAGSITEAMELSEPVEDETTTELVEMIATWNPKTAEGKKYLSETKKATQSHMKRQGSDDRLDERLAMEHGKESGKEQSYKSRRDESRGAKKKDNPHKKDKDWGGGKGEYHRSETAGVKKKTGDVGGGKYGKGGHYKDYA